MTISLIGVVWITYSTPVAASFATFPTPSTMRLGGHKLHGELTKHM